MQKHHGVAEDCSSFLQISLEAGQHHRALHCEREQSVTGLLTYSADGGVAHRTPRSRRHEVSSDKRCDVDVVGLAQVESIELEGFFRTRGQFSQ